jgi:hypothetical protein
MKVKNFERANRKRNLKKIKFIKKYKLAIEKLLIFGKLMAIVD